MPKLNYTAAKGLYEDGESMNSLGYITNSSGFSISDVAMTNTCKAITLAGPVYKLVFAADGVAHGAATSNYNGEYNDVLITLYDDQGAAKTVRIAHNAVEVDENGDGSPNNGIETAAAGTTYTDSQDAVATITHNTTQRNIAIAVGKAFASIDSDATFSYSVATDTAELYIRCYVAGAVSLQNVEDVTDTDGATYVGTAAGALNSAVNNYSNTAVLSGGSATETTFTVGTDIVITAPSLGAAVPSHAASMVITSDAANDTTGITMGSANDAPTESDGSTDLDASSFTLDGVTLSNGDSIGQEIVLINNCTNRAVNFNGAFSNASATAATDLLLNGGSIQVLVWNGSQWADPVRVSKVGTVAFS